MTALMLASIEGHSGVITVLLEFHASVKSKDQVFFYWCMGVMVVQCYVFANNVCTLLPIG